MEVSFGHPAQADPRARRTAGQVQRHLPAPLRVLGWALVALVAGVALGETFPAAMRALGAAVALEPGKIAWYAARITGFLAYFAMAGSVVFGLLLSTRLLDALAHRPVNLHLHRDLALVAVALSVAHGLVLLRDSTFPFTLRGIAIPLASPYAPLAVGIGQVAFYVAAAVAASFYVRTWIGQRAWRLVHYLTFAAFIGLTVHGLAAGSDSTAQWALWAYLVPLTAVVFLVTYRLVVGVAARREMRRESAVLVAPSAAPWWSR